MEYNVMKSCVFEVVIVLLLSDVTLGSTQINLGVVLPFNRSSNGKDSPWALDTGTKAGILYAIDDINSQPELLQGYHLNATFGDSHCSDTLGPLAAIDMYLKRTAQVFLGPACDYAVAPVARFSPHWNIPVITGGALVRALADKTQYKQLTRIGPTYAKMADLFLKLMLHFNWKHSAAFYTSNLGPNNVLGKSNCFFTIEAVYYTLMKLSGQDEYYTKAFDENQDYNATELLLDLSHNTRSM